MMLEWVRNNYGLVLALLVALALRVLWLDQQCFNMDEVHELAIARRPVGDIVIYTDSMPPGYSLLLKGWRTFWATDAAARWLSVLVGVAGVAFVAGSARELFDARTAAAAAAVLAIMPLHIYFSQFVRGYATFFFFASVALWFLVLALRRRRHWYWCGFAAASVLGIYVHYYFAIVILTSMVVILIERRSWWMGCDAFVAHLAMALAIVPLVALVPGDLAFQQHTTVPRPLGLGSYVYTYLTFFTGGSLGPSVRELHNVSFAEAAREIAPWAVALAVLLGLLTWDGWRAARERRVAGILLTLALLPPLVVGLLGHLFDLTYHFRFVVWCMIPVAIWLGAGLSQAWHTRRARLALVGLVVISGCALYHRNFVPRYENEDLRGVADYVALHGSPDEPVFVVSDYLSVVLRYYLTTQQPVVELPVPGKVTQSIQTEGDVARALQEICGRAKGDAFWFVYSRAFHGDPQSLLMTELETRYRPAAYEELAGVTLYRFLDPRGHRDETDARDTGLNED